MRELCIVARSAAVAAVVLLSACDRDLGQATPSTAPQVAVIVLKKQPVTLTRELPGRTSAFLVAEVRPQVSGIVKRRLFTEGSDVKAGQRLYDLDDVLYRAQYEDARARLRKAQVTLQAAQLAATRSRELLRIGAVSTQDNETAIAIEGQAQADVAAAQAAMATSGVSLAYAHIVAPISGRIGKSNVTQGALVTAEQSTALATIQQLDPLYVEVNQSSSDWLALRQAIDSGRVQSDGTPATTKILLEDGTEYGYAGSMQFADVTVDPATGNFLLRVIVPNPKLWLLPGMYVRAVLTDGALAEGVLVPQQGITRDSRGEASALIVDQGGRVELRAVRVSRAIGDQWLVDDGLVAGDRVIVEGIQKVKPGTAVAAVDEPAGGVAR